MLLVAFAALMTLGFGTWLIGNLNEWHGVAVVGALVIMATGGAVMLTDLTIRSGQVVENNHTVVDNETVVQNQTIQYQKEPVDAAPFGVESYSVGAISLLIGGLLASRHLSDEAI